MSSNGLDANLVRLRAWQDWTGDVPAPPVVEPPAPTPEPDPNPTEEVVVNVKLRKLSKKNTPPSSVVADVKRAQAIIRALSGRELDLDGRFGPKTEKAVRDWQAWHKLEVDGIVGPKTWTSLLEAGK